VVGSDIKVNPKQTLSVKRGINTMRVSQKNEKTELVTDRFHNSENFVRQMHEKFKKYYKLYRSYREEDNSTFSNLFIPHTFATIEQIVPRIIGGILGSTPPFSVEPRKPEDVEGAVVLELLLDWQRERQGFHDTLTRVIKDALIYGTGFSKSMWDEDMVMVDGVEEYRYRGPTFDYVSPWSFYPDPHASEIKDADYVIENYFVTMDQLYEWREQGMVGTAVGGVGLNNIDDDANPKDQEKFKRLQRIGTANDPGHDDTRDWVEIHEYWEDNRCMMVANGNTLIKDMDNPFQNKRIPYFAFRDFQLGDEFYGIGEVEIIEDLQEEVNTQRNQRLDVRNLCINPILMATPGSMIDEDDLHFAPGEIWNVDPGSVQPFAIPDTGTPSTEEEMMASQNIKETTSVTDIVKGEATQNTPDTATGVNTLDTNASTRFNMKVRNFDQPATDMVEHWARLNQQYLSEEYIVRLTGNVEEEMINTAQIDIEEAGGFSFLRVMPDQIVGNYDYSIKGAKSVNQMQRQQKFMQLLQIAGNFPSEVNIKELLRRLFRSLDVEDIDSLLNVEQQQLERLMEMQGGGGEQVPDEVAMEEGAATRERHEGNVPRAPTQTREQSEQELMGMVEGGEE